jgi:dihydropyrimidinase
MGHAGSGGLSHDTIVRGGTVVRPEGCAALDVAIAGGKVAALLAPGAGADAARVVDARGLHVFPGLIDAHVHFGFGEPVTEYTTETIYAAHGGFTTILGYFLNNESYRGVFERELALALPRSHVDFAFHFSTANELHLDELEGYVRDYGVTSFKYFMNFKGEEGRYLGLDGTDDGYLYALLEKAAAIGELVIVVHTENIELVNRFRRAALQRPMASLRDWSAVKPAFTESEACVRAMLFAEHLGATIYIPHLSTRLALDEVRRWRGRYDRVFVETCPHYLTHDENSQLGGLGKANPPFRTPDDVAAMWEGLADGSIDVVASDHVPRKRSTKEVPLWKASQGFPGTATILPVLLHEGYHRGRLSLPRIAQLLCAAPAAIFGLPQKGALEAGRDADLTLVDLGLVRTVDPAALGSWADYSLYEGQALRGWPVGALLRGEPILQDGKLAGSGGQGRYLRRS